MVGRIPGNVSSIQLGGQAGSPDTQVEPMQTIESNAESGSEMGNRLSADKAKTLTESMNSFLESANTQLRFKFHDELNEYYVTIVNSNTDEVIREIPSKKLLDIHAAMREFVGLLVDQKM